MIKNIIANFVGKFWSILSSFLFLPLYIHLLGFENYSIIAFTLVLSGLLAVLDAGLTATLSREFSRTDNEPEEKVQIFDTLETVYLVIVALCIVILCSMSGGIANHWLRLDAVAPDSVSLFLKIISVDIGFNLLFRFYMGGLLGLEKQVKANMYQVGWGMLRNGLVVVPIFFVPTLEMFFVWQAASTVLFVIMLRVALYKTSLNGVRLGFKLKIEKSVMKRIWRFSGGMLLITLVASLNSQLDKFTISKLLPIETLGYYTLAVSLSMGLLILVTPVSVALLPRFTAMLTNDKFEETVMLFNKIMTLIAIILFSFMANMMFFSKELIWIWTGKIDLAVNVYLYIPPMVVAYVMLAFQIVPYNIAIAKGYTRLNNILGILSLFVTVPGYFIFTSLYGAIGAAYLFCIVQTVIAVVYFFIISKKFLVIYRINFYIKQFIVPLVLSLSIAYVSAIISPLDLSSRFLYLVWIGLSTLTCLLINIIIVIPFGEIRQFFKSRCGIKNETIA